MCFCSMYESVSQNLDDLRNQRERFERHQDRITSLLLKFWNSISNGFDELSSDLNCLQHGEKITVRKHRKTVSLTPQHPANGSISPRSDHDPTFSHTHKTQTHDRSTDEEMEPQPNQTHPPNNHSLFTHGRSSRPAFVSNSTITPSSHSCA